MVLKLLGVIEPFVNVIKIIDLLSPPKGTLMNVHILYTLAGSSQSLNGAVVTLALPP